MSSDPRTRMAEAEDPIVVEDQDNPPCNLVPAKVGRPQHEASQFLETLNNFNKKYGVVSCRHPVVARQSLNLFSLFKFVQHYKVCMRVNALLFAGAVR